MTMSTPIVLAMLCTFAAPQEPAAKEGAQPGATAPASSAPAAASSTAKPQAPAEKGTRADGLRALSARSAIAEKDLLFTTKPEERALRYVASEKQRRTEDQKVKREELEFLEEGLRERSGEYRQLRASGRHAEADALIADGRREIVRDIREVLALRHDLSRSEQAAVQMDEAEDKLEKLVGHKQSERRRYERQRDGDGSFELGGIHPALIPEVSGGPREDALAPEVEALFQQLFGSGFDLSSFRRRVADGLRWRS